MAAPTFHELLGSLAAEHERVRAQAAALAAELQELRGDSCQPVVRRRQLPWRGARPQLCPSTPGAEPAEPPVQPAPQPQACISEESSEQGVCSPTSGAGLVSEGQASQWRATMSRSRSDASGKSVHPVAELWPEWVEESEELARNRRGSVHSLQTQSSSLIDLGHQAVRAGDELRDENECCLQNLVARPTSRRRLLWDLASFFFMGYDVIYLPLQAFPLPETPMSKVMDWATAIFWSCDMCLSFFVGYTAGDGGALEMRPAKIATRYLKSWFMLDITIVVVDWINNLNLLENNSNLFGMVRVSKAVRVTRMLRMFRLLRMLKVLSVVAEFGDLIQSEVLLTLFGIAKLTIGIAIVNHFIACGWYFMSDTFTAEDDCGWLLELPRRSTDTSSGYAYVTALHWSLTQFTPASMEVTPCNLYERVYTVCVIIFALVSFSSFLSSITTAMTHLRNINVEHARQQEFVRRYITDNKVHIELGNRIYAWLRSHSRSQKKKRVHEVDIGAFATMPETLRTQLRVQVYWPILQPHPFFHHCQEADEDSMVRICCSSMSEKSARVGEELFTVGEKATRMIFVTSGELEYHLGKGGERRYPVRGHICEMALWLQWQNFGTLSASTPCEVVLLDSAAFRAALRTAHSLEACQAYAQAYAEKLSSAYNAGERISDIWGDFDMLQEVAQDAFSECSPAMEWKESGSQEAPTRKRNFFVRQRTSFAERATEHAGSRIFRRVRQYASAKFGLDCRS